MSKVDAAEATLSKINPDVRFEAHNMDITTMENFGFLKSKILEGKSGSIIDLVI